MLNEAEIITDISEHITNVNTEGGITEIKVGQIMTDMVTLTGTKATPAAIAAKADINAVVADKTGTSYTLLSSDNGKVLRFTNSSAITLTVPTGLPVGFNCMFIQAGTGQITPIASGTTINNRYTAIKTSGQYASATIVCVAMNTFLTSGDLTI